jgi:two-component system, LuxR family, response regulator FixJ
VDDDSMVRVALVRLLRGSGYAVVSFERASDLLVGDLPQNSACLVLDICMPEMNGIELWKELRKRGVELPSILITGQRDERVRLWGKKIGAIGILYKPIEEQELLNALRKALEQRGS